MSNSLVIQSPQITSLDIAEMTGVRHDNVKSVIKRFIDVGYVKNAVLKETPNASKNGVIPKVYIFTGDQGERDSYVAIARISPQHIGNIIDAWGRTKKTLANIITALEQFDVPAEFCGMHVYAIVEKDTGNVKIGISADPERRLKELQTANSSELVLVATMPAIDRFKSETRAHLLNADNHIRGEWFDNKSLQYFETEAKQ